MPGSPAATLDVMHPRPPRYAAGHRVADRYRLDGQLGRGAMGTVWAATDEVLARRVALKEVDFPIGMPAAEIEQLTGRTLREARAVAALSNPFVITLFDILLLPSGPVIVMELLSARSLAEILSGVGRLSVGQAATVGVAVSAGLAAAHTAGIVHRDVKPGNVLVCDDGRVKLTDFGIARSASDQPMTATGLLLGSPAYISPEVASGRLATPQADAWGLGALLYACVEGRPPFDAGNPIATLTSVVRDPVPPHPMAGRLGGVLDALLLKDPERRMRVAHARRILQTIADDPTGTHLAAGGELATTRLTGLTPAPAPAPVARLAAGPAPGPAADDAALPPPPWAATDAAGMPALPAVAAPPDDRRRRQLLGLAVLVALIAAVAGFFAVRAVAGLAGSRGAAAAITLPACPPPSLMTQPQMTQSTL